ncbi:glycosyltransferase family 2 protein (plasmid) [Entomospira entomophila]|uniref:Glycosyltransferase family 2 protein n=1 Tax=Entomospira entomophila TaxID=2719988 RepID=A0A968KUE4_9SPIO|nr:glycosyltransferase family 2 protein [Entomospira entomophilus]NIZ41386.1 glycosyltransferase family 2 protein [Entomospira entomophilus]WDI36336.1 glycosyltransferase family 2 protein [Entomospira entomophilus]
MKISMIVPFYNVERYLRRCLESIVTQSYTNLEIILVNDCSSDGSLTIAREFAQRDERIQILEHTENRRQGGARNTGANVATGEYLWFIDSDDQIASRHSVMALVMAIEEYRLPDVLIFGFMVYQPQFRFVATSYLQTTRSLLTSHADLTSYFSGDRWYFTSVGEMVWNKIFQRKWFLSVGAEFIEKTVYEDNITPYWLFCAQRIVLLPEIHYHYHLRENSTTTAKAPADFVDHRLRYLHQAVEFVHQHDGLSMHQGYLWLFLLRQIFDPRLQGILLSYDRAKREIDASKLVRSFVEEVDQGEVMQALASGRCQIMAQVIDCDQVKNFFKQAQRGAYLQACGAIYGRESDLKRLFVKTCKLIMPYALVRLAQERRDRVR